MHPISIIPQLVCIFRDFIFSGIRKIPRKLQETSFWGHGQSIEAFSTTLVTPKLVTACLHHFQTSQSMPIWISEISYFSESGKFQENLKKTSFWCRGESIGAVSSTLHHSSSYPHPRLSWFVIVRIFWSENFPGNIQEMHFTTNVTLHGIQDSLQGEWYALVWRFLEKTDTLTAYPVFYSSRIN